MKVYAVIQHDQYECDCSSIIVKHNAFFDKNKALAHANKVYKSMCEDYADEMEQYSNEDAFEEVSQGSLYIEQDDEHGYYFLSFGRGEERETHCISVEEFAIIE